MVRNVLQNALEKGQNPRKAALDMVGRIDRLTGKRTGGFIGLSDNQAKYVMNARDDLETLNPRYFKKALRNKRFDSMVAKSIKDGKPLSQDQISKITGRYKQRLLKHRAETIARNESITAMRAGRHEGFAQLVESGGVTDDQIERTWDATGDARTRDDHRSMEGQKVRGMSTPFVAPDGSRMMYPGDTSLGAATGQVIQCRCFEKVRIRYDG